MKNFTKLFMIKSKMTSPKNKPWNFQWKRRRSKLLSFYTFITPAVYIKFAWNFEGILNK